MRVRKNDTVVVLTGKDRGKRGKVLAVNPTTGRVMVQGVAIVTRHTKARRMGETSGIRKKEAFIDLSKVMPFCAACQKPSRVNFKVSDDRAHKVRICNRCKGTL